MMRAFTLMEVLVVVALIGVVAVFTTGVDSGSLNRSNVNAEEVTLVQMLINARSRAMNNENESSHGVYVSATDFILFRGDSYAGGALVQATPRDTTITHTGDVEVVFGQLTGAASDASMTLSSPAQTASIAINSEGRIAW